MTEHEIRATCMRLDEMAKEHPLVVYYLSHAKGTFKLGPVGMFWAGLSEPERWCLVKYGNLFLSLEAAEEAAQRAITRG